MFNQFQTQYRQSLAVGWLGLPASDSSHPVATWSMSITPLTLLSLSLLAVTPARADLHITRDHGGYVTEYKAKYERIRDRKERVIIDGICNSACTMVFGIVPLQQGVRDAARQPRFHQAYYDKAFTLRHQRSPAMRAPRT